MNQEKVKRNYKDSLFRKIFREKDALLSLFNAVNGTNYTDPEELKITTIESAIYLTIKNDVSCLIDMRLGIFEHQSSINPNMPLRNLQYASTIFERDFINKRVYSTSKIVLPRPTFVVFYNGSEWQPEHLEMRLSDLYDKHGSKEVNLELVCVQLNINSGFNEELKRKCPLLAEYIAFVEKVRTYARTMSREDAVAKAIDESIRDGVLAEFLRKNRAEVKRMNLLEITEEEYQEAFYEIGYEEGHKLGVEQGIEQGILQQREKDEAEIRELKEEIRRLRGETV